MANLNLDVSQELNITTRRGDSISFTLTFKDDNGDVIDLISAADGDNTVNYDFRMEVRDSAEDDSDAPIIYGADATTLTTYTVDTGAATVNQQTQKLTITVNDSSNTVTFTAEAASMKNIFAGQYVYDIEARKVDSTTSVLYSAQTWLRGTFTVIEDVTIV